MTKNQNSKKPLIGILPDFKEGAQNGYSIRNYYALRANYVDSIISAGGTPIMLTYDYEAIDRYLEMLDGLLVVGGFMDLHPSRYGETEIHPTVKLNLVRENFEFEIVSKALKTNLPILGICNGMQLIAVIKGGKLIQHIPDLAGFIDHEQSHFSDFADSHKPYHDVVVEPNTKFREIAGSDKFGVNSSHHQGLKSVANGLKITAKSTDGMIEAFEDPNHPFCFGVQWHPEFQISSADKNLFLAFVQNSKNFNTSKKS